MKKALIILIVGAILAGLGFYQFVQYEENSIVVDAVVTDIKTKEDSEGDFIHTYYGKYTVNGKEYTNVKLQKGYSESRYDYNLHVGDTVELRVNPQNPAKKVAEGGLFGTVGLVMVVYGAVLRSNAKKAAKASQTVEEPKEE